MRRAEAAFQSAFILLQTRTDQLLPLSPILSLLFSIVVTRVEIIVGVIAMITPVLVPLTPVDAIIEISSLSAGRPIEKHLESLTVEAVCCGSF